MVKGLCILGSTGSIGQNSLRVVRSLPDRFRVVSLSAGRKLDVLAEQVLEFRPKLVAVSADELVEPLRGLLERRGLREPVRIVSGSEGRIEAATLPEVDCVVSASHGITGLLATYEAVRAGKRVGLANKETLVVAGELVTREAERTGAEVNSDGIWRAFPEDAGPQICRHHPGGSLAASGVENGRPHHHRLRHSDE